MGYGVSRAGSLRRKREKKFIENHRSPSSHHLRKSIRIAVARPYHNLAGAQDHMWTVHLRSISAVKASDK